MQVQVKFITSGSNSAFGSFEPGGLLRCSEEMANHLVNELGCAKYIAAPVVPVVPAVEAPKPSKRKAK